MLHTVRSWPSVAGLASELKFYNFCNIGLDDDQAGSTGLKEKFCLQFALVPWVYLTLGVNIEKV